MLLNAKTLAQQGVHGKDTACNNTCTLQCSSLLSFAIIDDLTGRMSFGAVLRVNFDMSSTQAKIQGLQKHMYSF